MAQIMAPTSLHLYWVPDAHQTQYTAAGWTPATAQQIAQFEAAHESGPSALIGGTAVPHAPSLNPDLTAPPPPPLEINTQPWQTYQPRPHAIQRLRIIP